TNIRASTLLQYLLANVRVAYFWECIEEKEVSEKAIELSYKSLDPNSTTTILSNLWIWTTWYTKNNNNPVHCPITDII
ncbi:33551_t:CDS:1, partial [Racocetra persica]